MLKHRSLVYRADSAAASPGALANELGSLVTLDLEVCFDLGTSTVFGRVKRWPFRVLLGISQISLEY